MKNTEQLNLQPSQVEHNASISEVTTPDAETPVYSAPQLSIHGRIERRTLEGVDEDSPDV
jgi:hypothetical protein